MKNKLIDSSITHIKRLGATQSSAGLSLIVQLKDSSYLIIDGGPYNINDEEELFCFLKKNSLYGKPQIVWLFTHAHHDHMDLALSFLKKYKNDIQVNMFCYNFPDFDVLKIHHEPQNRIEKSKDLIDKFFKLKNDLYKQTPCFNYKTGQEIQLINCKIKVLSTYKDLNENEYNWINHTSASFMLLIDNKKILVLGDCEDNNCMFLANKYKEELKCDILQVTHHGLNGGNIPIYSYADPTICFWPIDEDRFINEDMCKGTKSGFEYNAWLRNDEIKKRTHYSASYTTKIYIKDL